jgi:thiamine kinase-like enzyme
MRRFTNFILPVLIVVSIGVYFLAHKELDHENLQNLICKAEIDNCEIQDVRDLVGGYTEAQIHHITTMDDQDYVLRIFSDLKTTQQRHAEIQSFKLAEKAGIAPKLYWADPETGLLMQYIKPHPMAEPQNLYQHADQIAVILQKLHQLENFSEGSSKFEEIRSIFLENLSHFMKDYPATIRHTITAIEKIEQSYTPLIQVTATHNDINPNNIVYDGAQYLLIDWEFAHLGDPYFDLGSFAMFGAGDEEDDMAFLTAYFDRSPSDKEIFKFKTMKNFAKVFYGFGIMSSAFRDKFSTVEERDEMVAYLHMLDQQDLPPLNSYHRSGFELKTKEDLLKYGMILLKDFVREYKEN